MFNDAHHALSWAYETITRPVVRTSAANHMRQVPTKSVINNLISGLDAYERNEQAAAIIGLVDRLHSKEASQYLNARFGRRVELLDVSYLVFLGCAATELGLGKQGIVYKMVKSYFTGGLTYRDIRRALSCRDQQAILVRSHLFHALDVVHDRAMGEITEKMKCSGLIR
ncbi:MAG: hypothetical protein ABI216_22030 [Devosia sp.]